MAATLDHTSDGPEEVGIGARWPEHEHHEYGVDFLAAGRTVIDGVSAGRHADPFLEPEKDFLFLARFDGVNDARDQEQPVALLSIAGYFQPNALLVQ